MMSFHEQKFKVIMLIGIGMGKRDKRETSIKIIKKMESGLLIGEMEV